MIARLPVAVALLAVSVAGSAAEPASPVDEEVVIAAVNTCVAATAKGPLDRAMIEAAGWALGTVEADGEVKANAMEFRTRADSHLLMTTPPGEDLCVIVGRVANMEAFTAIRADLLAAYPGTPIDMAEAGEIWPSGNHMFSIAPTGRKNAPSVRVIVKGRGAN